jgi:predicted nucleotidyltransferase
MPGLDLPPAWLDQVTALLRRHVPEAEVWAYGSRVSGGAQPCSDLDLVVRDAGDPTRPVPGVGALREALRDSLIPILVDVHDWSALPPAFRPGIERQHRVVQDQPSSTSR